MSLWQLGFQQKRSPNKTHCANKNRFYQDVKLRAQQSTYLIPYFQDVIKKRSLFYIIKS